MTLPGGGSCHGAVGGSFDGDVALPSVVGGTTAADGKTGCKAVGSRNACGSCGGDVTLPVTVADCKSGSAATAGGSRGGDVMLPVTVADCKTGSVATLSLIHI